MRKNLAKTILILMLLASIAIPAFAQARGPLTNIWASWVNVTTAQTTITLPYNSRDVYIRNGSSTPVCIDLKGGTIPTSPNGCVTDSINSPSIIQLDADTIPFIDLRDYVTNAISMRTIAGAATASPVTVIVTY